MMNREKQIELMNALQARDESPLRAWIGLPAVKKVLLADLSSFLPDEHLSSHEPMEKMLAFG